MLYDANKDWSWPTGYIYNYGSNPLYSAYYKDQAVPDWKTSANPYPNLVKVGLYVYQMNSRYVGGNKESPLTAVDADGYRMWSLACNLNEYKSRWLSQPVEMMTTDGNKYFDEELEEIEPPPIVNYAAAYSPYPSTSDYKTDAEADYMHSVPTYFKNPTTDKSLYEVQYEGFWGSVSTTYHASEDINQELTVAEIRLPGNKKSVLDTFPDEVWPAAPFFYPDSPDYPSTHDENENVIYQIIYGNDGEPIDYATLGGIGRSGATVRIDQGTFGEIGVVRWFSIPEQYKQNDFGGNYFKWSWHSVFQGLIGTRPVDADRPTKATITYRHKMTVYHPFYIGRKFIGSAIFLESTTSAWDKYIALQPYTDPREGYQEANVYTSQFPLLYGDILKPGHYKIKRIPIEYEITWEDLYGHDEYREGDETDDIELEVGFADFQVYPEFVGIFLEKVTPDCSDD